MKPVYFEQTNYLKLVCLPLLIISLIGNNYFFNQLKSSKEMQLTLLQNEMNAYHSSLYGLKGVLSDGPSAPNTFTISKVLAFETSNRITFFLDNLLDMEGRYLNDFTYTLLNNSEKILQDKSLSANDRKKLSNEQMKLINLAMETFKPESTNNLEENQIKSRIENFLVNLKNSKIVK